MWRIPLLVKFQAYRLQFYLNINFFTGILYRFSLFFRNICIKEYLCIVSSKGFPPTKFKSKIVIPPFVPPHWDLRICPPHPFLWFPPLIYKIQISPTQNFWLIYSWFAQTDLQHGNHLKSCNSQEQKQLRRSKLVFQIHQQICPIFSHIPNTKK